MVTSRLPSSSYLLEAQDSKPIPHGLRLLYRERRVQEEAFTGFMETWSSCYPAIIRKLWLYTQVFVTASFSLKCAAICSTVSSELPTVFVST